MLASLLNDPETMQKLAGIASQLMGSTGASGDTPPVPEQPTKPEPPMPDKEADETENGLSSMPDSTPGEQPALFLFPVYSFSHGLDKIKTERHFCRPDAAWAGGQSIFIPP